MPPKIDKTGLFFRPPSEVRKESPIAAFDFDGTLRVYRKRGPDEDLRPALSRNSPEPSTS